MPETVKRGERDEGLDQILSVLDLRHRFVSRCFKSDPFAGRDLAAPQQITYTAGRG
jgi:hypothetical protein